MPSTTIDREAWPAAAVAAAPGLLAAATGRRRTALAFAALATGVVAFFRDPQRSVDHAPAERDVVLSPADGRVMYAGPAQPEVSPPGEWQQVSIFLSVFDVHINRAPYGGTVTDVQYRPGKWLAAYKFESAFENERSDITVVDGERTVIFRQIVGLVARRVVTRIRPGDRISTGQRIGLMKFGSRMDVFVPMDVTLEIEAGARAVGGVTTLGRW